MNASSPFIKQLASSDRRTRDAALEKLRSYLRNKKSFDSLELLKLWKGLFYCMWMSDRSRVQQQLARDLAGLVDVVSREGVVQFAEAFWKTMAREWVGIDVLRMDKFLYLVRVFLGATLAFFAKFSWKNEEELKSYISVLEETPFNPRDLKIPDGMRYHCLDVYVDELDKVDEKRSGEMPLETLLQPIQKLGKTTLSKSVRERVKETLEDDRLKDWLGTGESIETTDTTDNASKPAETSNEDEWGGIAD